MVHNTKKSNQKINKSIGLFIVPLMVFIGLCVMLWLRIGKPTEIITHLAMGKPVPSFALPLLSDTTKTTTQANLPNKPFILNVWGSWCPSCRIEHPFLLALQKQGVTMIGVNYKDELQAAIEYLDTHDDPFLYSIQDYKGDLALDLGLMGAPESYIVDGDGVIRMHIVGILEEQNWATQVQPCMAALADSLASEQDKAKACSGVGK